MYRGKAAKLIRCNPWGNYTGCALLEKLNHLQVPDSARFTALSLKVSAYSGVILETSRTSERLLPCSLKLLFHSISPT